MGVVKYTGPVASFHCPTNAEIRSLKVHFSPKQEGTGDPSPENVREIVGWDGVVVHNDDGIAVPEEYQKVEYLESDGGQIINTGYSPKFGENDEFYIEFSIDTNETVIVFGINNYTVNQHTAQLVSLNYRLRNDLKYYNTYFGYCNDGEMNTFYANKGVSSCIGVDSDYIVTEFESNIDNLYIFGQGNQTSTQLVGKIARTYYKTDGVFVLDFIPCRRKSDNKPGMYDTVTQTFFTNQGTGEFICGPDVGETVSYEFGVLGKNKFDKSQSVDGRITKINGTNYTAESGYYISPFIPVVVGASYTKNSPVIDAYHRFATYSSDNVDSFVRVLDTSNTITIKPDENYIRFCGEITELDTAQLELGSTATTYEPYDPNHTVYGGWVDLISGEVCEEWHKMVIDTTSRIGLFPWGGVKIDATTGTEYATALFKRESTDPKAYTIKDNLCDKLPMSTNQNKINMAYVYDGDSYGPAISLPTSIIGTTNETLTEYLTDNPFTFVYKQRVSNTYYLAPTELQTFLGQNNVWSNADYVEVEYDLHETQEILNRKAFIMANQPHLVVPEAAQLQSFTTDVPAPLKECKAYFKPKQNFNGYDRPWPAGGGKNLFNGTVGTRFDLPMAINDTYIASGLITGEGYGVIRLYDAAGTFLQSSLITYNAIDGRKKSNAINITNESQYVVISTSDQQTTITEIQIEKGSTATSYEPYENICPIEGWENIETYQAEEAYKLIPTDNQTSWFSNGITMDYLGNGKYHIYGKATEGGTIKCPSVENFVIPALSGKLFELHNNSTSSGSIHFYDGSNKQIDYWRFNSINRTSNSYGAMSGKTLASFGITFSADEEMDLTIEPFFLYNKVTIPITFPTEAGTIYGGYVDLVKGELVQTHICIDMYEFAQEHTKELLSENLIRWRDPYGCNGKSISTHFINNPSSNWGWMATNEGNYCQWKWGYIGLSSSTLGFTTEEEWKNWLAANNVKLIGVLATPIHYTLTPTQLKTLRGTNNIWSSANDKIEIKYWKH